MRRPNGRCFYLLLLVGLGEFARAENSHSESNPYTQYTSKSCLALPNFDESVLKKFREQVKELDALAKEDTAESYRLQMKKLSEAYLAGKAGVIKYAHLARLRIAQAGLGQLTSEQARIPTAYTPQPYSSNMGYYGNTGYVDPNSTTHVQMVEETYCRLALDELKKNPQAFDEAFRKEVEDRSHAFLSNDEKLKNAFLNSAFWNPAEAKKPSEEESPYTEDRWTTVPMPPETPLEKDYWKLVSPNPNFIGGKQYIQESYFGYVRANTNKYNLNSAEIHALQGFSSNGPTPTENKKVLELRIELLKSALDKIPPYSGPVYASDRSFKDLRKDHAIGKTITQTDFTVADKDRDTYTNDKFTIYSKTGRDVSPYVPSSTYKRVFFAPGTKFKILSIKTIGAVSQNYEYVLMELP